jgi:DNA helicase-2/ATP-dependent DNA helicase PcrA
MTALRAKGKEFDNVIILDANDGIWPIKMAQSQEQLEQERRLFYVAFTRAKKRLTILVNQSMLGQTATPSPYIAEMGLPIRRV